MNPYANWSDLVVETIWRVIVLVHDSYFLLIDYKLLVSVLERPLA